LVTSYRYNHKYDHGYQRCIVLYYVRKRERVGD